jgi:small subunit ribosomal protein S3
MTHNVHPYSHRLGIIRDWKSRWFGGRGIYQDYLKTDVMLREYLEKRLRDFYIDSIEMERGENLYRIVIKTSRPGMVIGRSGEGITKLRTDILNQIRRLKVEMPKDIRVDIEEIKDPDSRATIIAHSVVEGLEKRLPFRRVMKQASEKAINSRCVKGVKITLSGRLGGADMGRKENIKKGQIPLQTLRADVDFSRQAARLSYGTIGVKVWIYRGEIFEDKK